MNSPAKLFIALSVAALGFNSSNAQEPYPGWTFYNNGITSPAMSLVDLEGNEDHRWTSSYSSGISVYLLDDGKVLRGASDPNRPFSGPGAGGRVERLSWDSTVEWSYPVFGPNFVQHHDIEPLPNGNVLVTIWERYTSEEAIAMGRDPQTIDQDIYAEAILELEPVGTDDANVVWSWRVWDHLIQDFDSSLPNFGVPADHPEKIDINFYNLGESQIWMHANALDYNPQLDQIVLSVRNLHQVWIIPHAPGSDGDLLYRYGNPASYGRGTEADRSLWGSHGVHWIEPGLPGAGRLLLYNNGFDFLNPRNFSTFDEIETPLNANMTYDIANGQPFQPLLPNSSTGMINGDLFFSNVMSFAQRLPNGNTLICQGRPGLLHELAPNGDTVWDAIVSPLTFRAFRIGTFDSRLEGRMWESVGTDSTEVLQGILWSGVAEDMDESDDEYLTLHRPSGPIEMIVKGVVDVIDSPSQLNVTLESKHSLLVTKRTPRVIVTKQVELFNFETDEYELLEIASSTPFDQVLEIQVDSNAERFIEPVTGCVQARLIFIKDGLSRRLRASIDKFEIRVVN